MHYQMDESLKSRLQGVMPLETLKGPPGTIRNICSEADIAMARPGDDAMPAAPKNTLDNFLKPNR